MTQMLEFSPGPLPAIVFVDERTGTKGCFTARAGGASAAPFDTLNLSTKVGDDPEAVHLNRTRVEQVAGFAPGSIALLDQVHGTEVVVTDGCGMVGTGDALVTSSASTTVGVLTADCVPVLLAGTGQVAAVHAGWKGLVAGVIESAIEKIGGSEAAWVGPSIHACCYEVGPEVVEAFRERALPAPDADRVDPGRAALEILRRSGVGRIGYSDECTSCDRSFFSYRRDGLTGRQGGFIAWA